MFSESSNRRNLNLTTWLKQPKVYGSHQLSSKYQLKVKVSVLSDLVPASPWAPHYLGFSPLSDNFYTARLPEWGHKVIFSFYLTIQYVPTFPANLYKIVVARNLPENSLLLLEADPFTENHSGDLHHIRICLKGIKDSLKTKHIFSVLFKLTSS